MTSGRVTYAVTCSENDKNDKNPSGRVKQAAQSEMSKKLASDAFSVYSKISWDLILGNLIQFDLNIIYNTE